ncbi:AbrB/MazE/SpoVT family DNA-binding domain-containing protein [Candidatus Woesearchaeota archaeon]|nr:MAG: AbrB family transcriptional regulator [archaeon GW2011_AR4]MBS3129664.1 AbrB/MazE/SpoVT family DNA-binding domain-containing protein [Candidatus Woesearchaeota archaeon]HIH38768.1 AbrB/MazE/SpoVT family DNA-binding domain-containing protein [Candidatus Woesearchaeota archaeon]HIH49184.1 AbrB/MazE/SpoVT family DNA-binding domain-containing protein [Candidatus Woesearchaeota archaeon]HIJ03326.1 AbrB/MazE/SpoVT family DNA-binding domain-containing protein [Candidatus Woesearchaeota archaeo
MPLIEMRTATITEKGQIAIPKDVRKKGFATGKKVAILAFEDRIEIRPMNQVNEKMMSAFASEKVLAKDWNSKDEEKAWKHL